MRNFWNDDSLFGFDFHAQPTYRDPFASWSWSRGHEFPLTDVHETDEAVRLLLDLPGVERDAIKISAEDQRLVITGTRTLPSDQQHQERWNGDFSRRFRVDKSLDLDNVSAKLEAGVLTVTVPRRPETKPKTIKVE